MKNKKIEMDEILSNYKNISIEKMLDFLEEQEKSLILNQLQNKTINLDQLETLCHKSYPNNPKLAEIYNELLSKKIAQNKEINIEGKNAENIKLIIKLEDYRDKVSKGTLSQTELKDLCNITFCKDSEESKKIYDNMQHLIKTEEQLKYEENQEKLKKEMLEENTTKEQSEENKISL